MSDNDEATIVLDFKSLKSQLKDEQELVESKDLTLEFQIREEDGFVLPKRKKIYLFEHGSNFFTTDCSELLNHDFVNLISDLNHLNKVISEDKEAIIAFYYNSAPKAINQLCLQLNKKFLTAKKVIIAKNLSDAKAKVHAATPSKADQYFSAPFEMNDFLNKVSKL